MLLDEHHDSRYRVIAYTPKHSQDIAYAKADKAVMCKATSMAQRRDLIHPWQGHYWLHFCFQPSSHGYEQNNALRICRIDDQIHRDYGAVTSMLTCSTEAQAVAKIRNVTQWALLYRQGRYRFKETKEYARTYYRWQSVSSS